MHQRHFKHFIELVGLCIYSTEPYDHGDSGDKVRPGITVFEIDGRPIQGKRLKLVQRALQQDQAEERRFAGERNRHWPEYDDPRVYGRIPASHTGDQDKRPVFQSKPATTPPEGYFGTASNMVWAPVLEGTAVNEMALDFIRDTTVSILLSLFLHLYFNAPTSLLDSCIKRI